jgi:crotonobetainyl-CoA:carnitine CoA-transferase CaiB-like acyl-CoA transferase
MTGRPLDHVTVVSLEQAVAAPYATRQLADMGARVIKVERPGGDFARGYDDALNGLASYFVWLNRNKESVVLDLKTSEGSEALRRLIARADVLVQNLAPGAMQRLGFEPRALAETHPHLIIASVSGYGEGGPFAAKKAYDALIQGEAGIIDVTGSPEQAAKVGVSIADIAAGMYAYSGVLAALLQRGITGRGEVLEVSMLEALAEWTSQPMLYARYAGRQPARAGTAHPTIAPYGEYPTATGPVYFGIQNEREWASFCTTVLDTPELARDSRFSSNTRRVQNRSKLADEIAAGIGALPREEVVARLDRAGIANAEVRTLAEVARHPQLRARSRWGQVTTSVGPIEVLIPPVVIGDGVRLDPVPDLGADTERVLAEIGMSAKMGGASGADDA